MPLWCLGVRLSSGWWFRRRPGRTRCRVDVRWTTIPGVLPGNVRVLRCLTPRRDLQRAVRRRAAGLPGDWWRWCTRLLCWGLACRLRLHYRCLGIVCRCMGRSCRNGIGDSDRTRLRLWRSGRSRRVASLYARRGEVGSTKADNDGYRVKLTVLGAALLYLLSLWWRWLWRVSGSFGYLRRR